MRVVIAAFLLALAAAGQDIPEDEALKEIGRLYSAGRYAEAIPLAESMVAARERALGPEHPGTASSMTDLAALYESLGEYTKAERLYLGALAIFEKTLGPDHSETANCINGLAVLYKAEAAYDKAEPLYLRALAIREKVFGPEHLETAVVLQNLAVFYESQARYQEAELRFLQALGIFEKRLGPEHPHVANALNGLAVLYKVQGDYKKAEPRYARALAIREKVLGPAHPDTAKSLNNLALLYQIAGEYGKAEEFDVRALEIFEKTVGPDHLDTAFSVNTLAFLYATQGFYEKAEPLFKRALAIHEKALGPGHPNVANSLNNLATVYVRQGEYPKAANLYARALAIYEKSLGPEHPEALAMRKNLILSQCANGEWKLAAASLPAFIGNAREKRDLAFGRDSEKRMILGQRESLLSVLRAGSMIPAYRRVYLPLLLRTTLASKARFTEETSAALESMKLRAGTEERKLLTDWRDVGARLSLLTLAGPGNRPMADFRKELADLEMEESDLAAKIAASSADFRTLIADPSPNQVAAVLGHRVLVEILSVDRFMQGAKGSAMFGDRVYTALVLFPDGRIDMVDLGEAGDIDSLAGAYRKAQEVSDNKEQADALARKLGGIVMAPIIRMVGNSREWFVASDGDLRLIPLGALLLSDGRYAAQSYKIWSLGSGRDLLALHHRNDSGGGDLILPNPDFGVGGGGFTSLPETEDEAEAIGKRLPKAHIVEEADRTKRFLLGIRKAPRILHLATHAYYKAGTGDATLRSGIALNGANNSPDGVLTAKDAQSLNLRGTELVVLSACETGVGEVSFGDGLVGLQRSLIIAGARSQMLTQWPVNSIGTRDFMSRFYGKLAAGKTKGDAWIETQRDLIRAGVAAHFWAPFVLYGDPGPLNEK